LAPADGHLPVLRLLGQRATGRKPYLPPPTRKAVGVSEFVTLDELPASLREAVRYELRAALHRPYTVPRVVTFNGLLMAAAWFLLPTKWLDWLFTLHGPLAFAMVMAAWMYSDVPATNVLAPDSHRVMAVLDQPAMVRRLLIAKNLTLWCFVAPFCTLVAVIIGDVHHDWPPTLVSVTVIAIVPFGSLGVAAWVGILWPYHPRDLRFRWQHRHKWLHMIVRWIALLLIPYALVPVLGLLIITPSLVLWSIWSTNGLSHRVPTTHFAGGAALAAAISMSLFYCGHQIGLRIIRRRHNYLRDYLSNPDRG
jgi:hypothetical protein